MGSTSAPRGSTLRLTPAHGRLPTLGYVQRLYDFLRRHPTWVDSFWAVVLLGISGVSLTNVNGAADQRGSLAAALPIAVVLSGSVVALRRLMPEKMLVLAAVVGVAQVVLDVLAGRPGTSRCW